ncbi:hypothetical protein TNCV_2007581 [Trichonephila clavipes]|nr:hypothetical protein TNCV_2007581 [Trichonephila clavipes]
MMELGISRQIRKGDDQLAGDVKMASLEGHFPDKTDTSFHTCVVRSHARGDEKMGSRRNRVSGKKKTILQEVADLSQNLPSESNDSLTDEKVPENYLLEFSLDS